MEFNFPNELNGKNLIWSAQVKQSKVKLPFCDRFSAAPEVPVSVEACSSAAVAVGRLLLSWPDLRCDGKRKGTAQAAKAEKGSQRGQVRGRSFWGRR